MHRIFTKWFFYTLIAGLLSIGFKWAILKVLKTEFNYLDFCSDVYLFNMILSFNGIGEILDNRQMEYIDKMLLSLLAMLDIVFSGFYTISLISDYGNVNLDISFAFLLSLGFSIVCIIINILIQYLKRVREYGY